MKKFLILLVLSLFITKTNYAQVSQADFEALVALYNATDGDNWNDNTNWDINATANDVTSDWFGITVSGGRVTKIKFWNNNLVGDIPPEIGNLTNLTSLYLSNNQLTGIPPGIGSLTKLTDLFLGGNQLTSIPSEIENLTNLTILSLTFNQLVSIPDLSKLTKFYRLEVDNNSLDFEDLKNANIDWNSIPYPDYSPQKDIILNKSEINGNVTFSVIIDGSNNQYKWFKNDIEILGQTTNSLTVENTISAVYHCEINDVNFPNLTLRTTYEGVNVINGIIQNDYNALISLYDATNGENWESKTNWKTEELVSSWYGITVSDFRVSRIVLKSNNLIGSLPAEIGNLTSLIELQLFDNNITSLPPEFGNLIKLKTLRLIGNDLTSLPKEFGNLVSLSWVEIWNNNLTSIPSEIGNLTNLGWLHLGWNQITSIPDLSGLTKLYGFHIRNNNLDFGDLENIKVDWSSITNLTYEPQSEVSLTRSTTNEQETLTSTIGGSNNIYKWFKNDIEIIGQTGNSITINNTESGFYHCQVTNENFPDLTINSTKIPAGLTNGVFTCDYNALITLYDATNGDNWITKTNWKSTQPVNSWYGISVNNYRVTRIYLANNNLVGGIPSEISNLEAVTSIRLNNNHMISLTNLIELTNLNQLYLNDNSFDFGDLEMLNIDWASISYITYGSQANVALQIIDNNDNFTLAVLVDGTNNVYKWFINGVEIEGETNNSILIDRNSEIETFYCEITDTNFPDLTLTSESVTMAFGIQKTEYDALVAIYNSTDGDNWTEKNNWLSDNLVSEWYGVNVSSGKVFTLSLADNNLSGNIPAEIGDLTNLFMLSLYDNNLGGSIPSSIGNLTGLNYLGLSGNQLSGTVPSSITNISNLANLVLFDNQLTELPNLSALTNLDIISVGDNKFTFEDIEPNIGIASMDFYYSPQAKVGTAERYLLNEGENKSLTINVGGDNNVYKWYKNADLISGANTSIVEISNFSSYDEGEYYCEITNTVATDLSLTSETFTLVQAYTVTFDVSDSNGKLGGATVFLNNYGENTTNTEGVTIFENIETETNISYTIKAEGCKDYTGIFDITDQNVRIDIILTNLYTANFNISDNKGAVNGATVSLGSYGNNTSNTSGVAEFSGIEPETGIAYTITANNHDEYTGTLDVVDQNVAIDILLIITGINNIEDKETIVKVYPNPSKGQFNINLDKLPSQNTYLEIMDLSGKTIYKQKLEKAQNQINVETENTGTYILQIIDQNKVYLNRKILIVK